MRAAWLVMALLVPLCAASATDLQAWQECAQQVLVREWSAVSPPPGLAGRPEVAIREDPALNARAEVTAAPAGSQLWSARIVLCTGLAEGLASKDGQPDVDALAGVIGHELAHLVLGHYRLDREAAQQRLRDADTVIAVSISREQEFAADLEGARIAARAGYDPGGLVDVCERGRALLSDAASWDLATGDHPTFTERLVALDAARAELWRAALDFEVGVDLLRGGNFVCAQECFRAARAQFPDSPEVLGNLGYALLLEYYHRLPPDYWTTYRIGQPLPVGYASFLPVPPRRSQSPEEAAELRRKWLEAVEVLQAALARQSDDALALGNLGLAYLVAPDGPDLEQARASLERLSPDVTPSVRWRAQNDLALVAWRQGDRERALELLQQAVAAAGAERSAPSAGVPAVNRALVLAESEDAGERHEAVGALEAVLPAYPGSADEWGYVYGAYAALCAGLGRAAVPEDGLQPPKPKLITPHLVWRGSRIYLADTAGRLRAVLGSPEAVIPVGQVAAGGSPEIGLACWRYAQGVLELTFLRSTLVRVSASGPADTAACQVVLPGGRAGAVSLGGQVSDLERLLGSTYDDTVRLGEGRPYRLYSRAQLAVRVEEGRIVALALAGVRS